MLIREIHAAKPPVEVVGDQKTAHVDAKLEPTPSNSSSPNPDIVGIGAGPVGLILFIKLAMANKNLSLLMLERHTEYKRVQRLRLDMRLIEPGPVETQILGVIKDGEAKYIDPNHIDIPIQALENCLLSVAKKLGIKIEYKQFLTKEQFQQQLTEHKVEDQKALEEKLKQQVVVGVEQISKLYPKCKMLIGSDGARSSVRELITEKDDQLVKKDLRNMIELRYQVKGKTSKLSAVEFPLTQPLLNGFLCTEHVKYRDDKDVSDITLNFLVDKKTFKDPLLDGINAKNLLPLTTNIPTKLRKAINLWVQTRRDKDVVIGSPTLNKTTLSIYTSKKYCQEVGNMMVLLVGDSSCGFPFMNGLNLGIENASHLVKIISENWDKIKLDDQEAMHRCVDTYSQTTEKTYQKGNKKVQKANDKIKHQKRGAKVLKYSSLAIGLPIQYIRSAEHEIFSAQSPFNLNDLINYVNKKVLVKSKHDLAEKLLTKLSQCEIDFDAIKSILMECYQANKKLKSFHTNNKVGNFFNGMLPFSMQYKRKSAVEEEKTITLDHSMQIPEDLIVLNSKEVYSKTLNNIIYNLLQHLNEFEKHYKSRLKSLVATAFSGEKSANISDAILECLPLTPRHGNR